MSSYEDSLLNDLHAELKRQRRSSTDASASAGGSPTSPAPQPPPQQVVRSGGTGEYQRTTPAEAFLPDVRSSSNHSSHNSNFSNISSNSNYQVLRPPPANVQGQQFTDHNQQRSQDNDDDGDKNPRTLTRKEMDRIELLALKQQKLADFEEMLELERQRVHAEELSQQTESSRRTMETAGSTASWAQLQQLGSVLQLSPPSATGRTPSGPSSSTFTGQPNPWGYLSLDALPASTFVDPTSHQSGFPVAASGFVNPRTAIASTGSNGSRRSGRGHETAVVVTTPPKAAEPTVVSSGKGSASGEQKEKKKKSGSIGTTASSSGKDKERLQALESQLDMLVESGGSLNSSMSFNASNSTTMHAATGPAGANKSGKVNSGGSNSSTGVRGQSLNNDTSGGGAGGSTFKCVDTRGLTTHSSNITNQQANTNINSIMNTTPLEGQPTDVATLPKGALTKFNTAASGQNPESPQPSQRQPTSPQQTSGRKGAFAVPLPSSEAEAILVPAERRTKPSHRSTNS